VPYVLQYPSSGNDEQYLEAVEEVIERKGKSLEDSVEAVVEDYHCHKGTSYIGTT
jgi:hypothetical protein